MIDPSDIFNAHRVVKSPIAYRPATRRMPLLPHPPALRDPARRGSVIRSTRRAAQDQVSTIRSYVAREIAPRIRKR